MAIFQTLFESGYRMLKKWLTIRKPDEFVLFFNVQK
jgi:hypothetical protein